MLQPSNSSGLDTALLRLLYLRTVRAGGLEPRAANVFVHISRTLSQTPFQPIAIFHFYLQVQSRPIPDIIILQRQNVFQRPLTPSFQHYCFAALFPSSLQQTLCYSKSSEIGRGHCVAAVASVLRVVAFFGDP